MKKAKAVSVTASVTAAALLVAAPAAFAGNGGAGMVTGTVTGSGGAGAVASIPRPEWDNVLFGTSGTGGGAGLQVAAVNNKGQAAIAKVAANGKFTLKVPKSKISSLALVLLTGTKRTSGPILLARSGGKGYVLMTTKTGALGKIVVHAGYAAVAKKLSSREYSKAAAGAVKLSSNGRPNFVPKALAIALKEKGYRTDNCAAKPYPTGADPSTPGSELIDQVYGQVWILKTLSQEDFEAIDLYPTWFGWVKNTPREILGSGVFFKSPDCASDGLFSYKQMYGHNWLNVAAVDGVNEPVDEAGLITKTTNIKYEDVTWKVGVVVNMLTAPSGQRYMLKTRDLSRTSDTSTLPAGWTISPKCTLKTQLQLPLHNRVTNYRTSNGDSFQAEEGGLDSSFNLTPYCN